MNTNKKEVQGRRLLKSRVGAMMHRQATAFAVFAVFLYVYLGFIVPALTAPIGGVLTPLGALASFASFLVIAFVGYWLYAFIVKRTGAEPE